MFCQIHPDILLNSGKIVEHVEFIFDRSFFNDTSDKIVEHVSSSLTEVSLTTLQTR